MDRWTAIRQVAARTLEDFERWTGRPAFTEAQGSYAVLEEVAERCLHLSVLEDSTLGANVSGKLDPEEETILVRPGLAETRRRIVVAHEIGHPALGHPPRQIEADLDEHIIEDPNPRSLTVRDNVYRTYSDRDRLELEANVFAIELLAPVHRVRERALADPNWTVSSLATYFGLSRTAMLNQLSAALLGGPVPKPASVPPEMAPGLDPQQEKAARAQAPALILAGPGAGKTRVLVARVGYLLEQGTEPDRILALTFANKATEELRDQIAVRFPDDAHRIRVATYHALGLDLLQAYGTRLGLKSPLRLLTQVDAFVFLRTRLAHLPLGSFEELYYPTRHLGVLQWAISRAKDELVSPERFTKLVQAWQDSLGACEKDGSPDTAQAETEEAAEAARCADVAAIYAVYQQWLREEGYLDYGDLIAEAVRLFDIPEVAAAIRAEFDHILVDEFQDINYASGRLIQALDGGRGITWAVGDPRQSIYRFRGASPVNLRNFTTDFPDAQILPLVTNYRSVEEVVRAGQAVRLPARDEDSLPVPELRSDRGPAEKKPAVEVIVAPTGADEIRAVTDRVSKLVQEAGPEQVAVLCRTRAKAQSVSEALERRGVPTNWGGALVERPAFKDLMGILLLGVGDLRGLVRVAGIPEHRFAEADLRLLLQSGHAHGGSAHAALYRAAGGEIEGFSEAGREQADRLKRLAGKLGHQATPWHTLALYLFEEAEWPRVLIQRTDVAAQRCLATLGQVADLMREFSDRRQLAGGEDLSAFLAFGEASLESGMLGDAGISLTIPGAVTVTTAHQSKGLEWPFVFLPQLADGQFPAKDRPEGLRLPPGLRHGEELDDHAQEEACLFYVGVTRARDQLILARARKYGRLQPAASPLLELLVSELKALGWLQLTETTASVVSEPESKATESEGWMLPEAIPHRALETYDTCPRRFLFEWVYGLRDEDRGYQQFHRVVYQVLAWAAAQAADGTVPSREAVQAELDARWSEAGPKEHRLEPLYRRRAEKVVEQITGRLAPGELVRFRHEGQVVVGGRTVLIPIDEDGPKGRRRHRFGKPAKSHREDPLLKVLGMASLGEHGVGPAKVKLHYAMDAFDEEAEPTLRVQKNWIEKMEKAMGDIEAGHFPPKPSIKECPMCPFYLICPSQMT
jgi:DNA helicase-2/ATP-dependent DNA helicase PcrA